MNKEFHIQGPCSPRLHYMADNSAKLEEMITLMLKGKYFIISRPRQYGKTTALQFLARKIQEKSDFIVYPISFEGMGKDIFENEAIFCQRFMKLLTQKARFASKSMLPFLKNLEKKVTNLGELSDAITDMIEKSARKVVLLIDEVDSSSNHQTFLNFLGMLRNKFIQTHAGFDFTFHSVVLAGVHDIKTLKLQIRTSQETQLNSPWNIAAEFTIDMSFSVREIIPMLEDYVKESGVQMNSSIIALELFDYTAGYPFLVSKICKVVDENILPQKQEKTWNLKDLEDAVSLILREENFNFDSLIKNLENNPDLYETVYALLLENKWLSYNIHNPIIKLGVTYGIFKNNPDNGRLQIHNKIYQQLIYNYMVSKIETNSNMNRYHQSGQFYLSETALDMNTILTKFQTFMKEHHSDKDQRFLEREGRLIFLAFLKPIINGKGHIFLEPQISDEKRIDVVITFHENKYIVELKLWYGLKAHEEGLVQLTDYLQRQNHHKGWLLIFDHRKNKHWNNQTVQVDEKDIFAVWV